MIMQLKNFKKEGVEKASALYDAIIKDERTTLLHLCLYMTLLHVWGRQSYIEPFSTSRSELMKHSKINSIATYHRYLKELIAFGYISYQPSFHPNCKSSFSLKTPC